ncbi:Mechanosensitive ion channel protein 4 [Coccomyxa sp. Obi]|nr:Mechanosensitive ion channel protein 4 [Coccomyxa sp. Obi]
MKGGETELLEVLIAKDSPKISKNNAYDELDGTFVSVPAESLSGGSKAAVKKGILKKGPALRRASSMTSGRRIMDDERPKTAEERISLHAHWHHENPGDSVALFQKYWDALPPLPKASSNRTRSLQLPVVSPVPQDTCTDQQVVDAAEHMTESTDSVPLKTFRLRAETTSRMARSSTPAADADARRRSSQPDEIPVYFPEFDKPTRRGSMMMPAALPRDCKPDDEDSLSSSSETVYDAEEDEEHHRRPFYRRKIFSRLTLPFLASMALFVAGILVFVLKPGLALWKFEAWRWLVFIAGTVPLYGVSRLVMHLLVVGLESHFVARGALYYVVGLRRWLQRTLCVAFFMGLFAGLFQQSVNRTADQDLVAAYWIIMKTAGCILLACSANVLKTLIAKLMSNHFYRDSYFEKMQDALCKEYYLVALAQQRPATSDDSPTVAKSGVSTAMGKLADSIRAASHVVLPRLSPRPLSPRTGQGIGARRVSTSDSDSDRHSAVSHISRVSHMSEAQRSLASITSLMSTDMRHIEYDDVVPVLPAKSTTNNNNSFLDRLHRVEKHLRKNKLKLTLTERLGAAHEADDVSSQAEAKKLAFYLFWNCKSSFESTFVELEDLQVFLPEEQARDCLDAFDCDADGHISSEDMKEAVIQIYDNRKNLSATLKDTKTIVGKLERLLGICFQLLFIFFYLAIFDVNLTRTWLTVSSLLLSFVFVFGNSIRAIYESVVYLFVVRPFDVGDVILLGPTQDWCTVEEITLMNTIFIKWDGSRILCPNAKLSIDMLTNVTRSQKKGESFKVLVDIGTPSEVFDRMGEAIGNHVSANPQDFTGEYSVHANVGADPMKLAMVFWWSYCYNPTSGRMMSARTQLLLAINEQLRSEGVLYTLPPYQTGGSNAPVYPPEAAVEHGSSILPHI